MSALYRQARPTTFDEMVGQEHVKEVLLNALRSGRLAQAYLFSGPRGVGKTSSARLIAQAVNCLSEPKPCGVCEGCLLVREARHPDVLEIDAASNNSVEDVRDLRERILLAPIMSPQDKKVVILDEAHMMSKSAFNALLKTLEEPPEHVIFIFATTEPERMPPTILSRTQHFRFRRLSEPEIVQKLTRLLGGMGREAEPQALSLVARMADGAMRDAESLLDRLLTLEGTITLVQTEAALGLPPQESLFAVAEALDRGQIKGALEQSQHLYTQGFAARTLAQGLLEAIRAGLYGRMGLGVGPHLDHPEDRLVAAMTALDEALERLLKRSDALSLELAVLAAYQALHTSVTSSSASPHPTPHSPQPSIPDFDPRPQRSVERPGQGSGVRAPSSGENPEPQPSSPAPAPQTPPPSTPNLAQDWRQVLGRLKPTIRAFFLEGTPHLDDKKLVVVFPDNKSFHHSSAQKNQAALQETVTEILGDFEVELRLGGKKKVAEAESPRPSAGPSRPVPAASAAPEVPPVLLQPEPEVATPTPPPEPVTPPTAEPPPSEPWFPEEAPFQDEEGSPVEDEPNPAKAAPEGENLLDDPRYKQLVKLFGGRLKKYHKETPKAAEPEAAAEADTPEE